MLFQRPFQSFNREGHLQDSGKFRRVAAKRGFPKFVRDVPPHLLRSGGRRQVPLDHHPHIVKRRRRHHAGNDEQLRERPGPIWTRQRSRPAVGAFAAGRVLLLLLLYLRRRKRYCAGSATGSSFGSSSWPRCCRVPYSIECKSSESGCGSREDREGSSAEGYCGVPSSYASCV